MTQNLPTLYDLLDKDDYLYSQHNPESLFEEMGGIPVDDLAHAYQVAKLAHQLFIVSMPFHGYGEKEAELLRRAALLHDAGIVLEYRQHHKLSMKLILKHGLPHLSEEEVKLIACIARYHRRALPQKHHKIYEDLSRSQQEYVCELGGILRLSDAFDYEHDSRVHSLSGYVLSTPGKSEHMLLQVHHSIKRKDSLARVIAQSHRKRSLFMRAFQCRLSIVPIYKEKEEKELK
jgi:exopolyphosphatase/pppGpp-phosphohydrolase